jgi:hypothetical protein
MTVVSHKTVNNDVRKLVFSGVILCNKDKVLGLARCDNGVERSPTSRIVRSSRRFGRVAPRLRGVV